MAAGRDELLSVDSEDTDKAVVNAPAAFKSDVWKHFGLSVSTNAKGEKVTDRESTVCKHCHIIVRSLKGNTSNMRCHLTTHHPEKFNESAVKKVPQSQKTLQEAFSSTIPHNSARTQEITRYIAEYIATDLRPFSAVDGIGFKRLVAKLEPRYKMPSRAHFSQAVFPALYRDTKVKVIQELKESDCVAITTDGWTSRATPSYITITAHVLTNEWEMKSYVLQTRLLSESHTGLNIAGVLTSAVKEWELDNINQSTGIAVVTDNASNMRVAVNEAGLSPHIKCFAHTLNLASQAGLKVNSVSRLLGRIRRVASFFHRSSTATAVLSSKQRLLNLPVHKLVIDVMTRWNSSLDMVERYLEQQQAVAAALLSNELRHKSREIDTLDTSDIPNAEDLVKLLTPIKKVTTVLCDESQPTSSLISPLKQMILDSMIPNAQDSSAIAQMKAAILKDLSERYRGEEEKFLQESSALDPRFRTLQHLCSSEREDVFGRIQLKATHMRQQDQDDVQPQCPQLLENSDCSIPPPKKNALEDLLGSSFSNCDTEDTSGIKAELNSYCKEPLVSLSDCPLKWWRSKAGHYPLLSSLAKTYLCIPATSVPSERVFSTAGDIVTAQRSLLLPCNVDLLIFLKKNLKIS